jgi:2-methylcitrate dehydratase PrpD
MEQTQYNDHYLMDELCEFIMKTKFDDLPARLIAFASRHILDTTGAIISGSYMKEILPILDFVKEQQGKEESHILVYGGKVPASMCAFVLGPMARATDLGDAHAEAGHSAEYTLPALIAATGLEERVSGKDLLLSFILGQEVLIRTGKACKCVSCEQSAGNQGGHYIFGPVVAIGRLLGLNKKELHSAFGMAKCMTQPYDMSMYSPANSMVSLHHGFIAQDAVNICLLAKKGIEAHNTKILSGEGGFYSLFARNGNEIDISEITNNLGKEWEMTNVMFKAYPSCNCTHTSIQGILEQMNKYHFAYQDIKEIRLEESLINWVIVGQPYEVKWNPQSVSECQFSLPYTVAAAACKGDFFLDAYTEENIFSPAIRDLMKKITVIKNTNLPPYVAKVTTELKSGESHTGEYSLPKGHPGNPFSDTELIEKFKKSCSYAYHSFDDAVIDKIIKKMLSLEKVDDVVKEIILPLTPM